MELNFWTGLFGGLLIGWLIEWIIDWVYWRNRPTVAPAEVSDVGVRAQNDKLRQELSAANRTIEQLRVDLMRARDEGNRRGDAEPVRDAAPVPVRTGDTGPMLMPASAPAPRQDAAPRTSTGTTGRMQAVGNRDSLRELHGIGPALEQRLYSAGITTFAMLAEQDPERLRDAIGIRHLPDADPASWISQARERVQRTETGETE